MPSSPLVKEEENQNSQGQGIMEGPLQEEGAEEADGRAADVAAPKESARASASVLKSSMPRGETSAGGHQPPTDEPSEAKWSW